MAGWARHGRREQGGAASVQGIVEDLEAVDRNAIEEKENLSMEDETDDEDDDEEDGMATQAPVPEEWNRPDASSIEAMDMHGSRYKYGCSMIEQEQLFRNKQELKDTVSRWAVTSLREVFVKVSSPSKYSPRKPLVDLMQRMHPFMDVWDQELQDCVEEHAPYTDLGMEMQHDVAEAVALLRGHDSSGRYDDVIEMFPHLGQKAKRLIEVVTCRQADDIVRDWSSAEGFGYGGMPQEMDFSQIFTQPQPTPGTQEIVEDKVIPAAVPQRREIRPAARFSPANYEKPRAPASARKPKRARGERQGRGGGQE
ncbi:hypothetical protein C2845_PM10G14350 [Panicum miliaceum]|uniref:Uncharacterized protein n=1 Tax=Panicum miliaceum TaxID=4540 RepID=A0A3L6PHR9_PANMI|nr:hypothetical protein C2845_PM10G14350 [Panicum miliaceum]